MPCCFSFDLSTYDPWPWGYLTKKLLQSAKCPIKYIKTHYFPLKRVICKFPLNSLKLRFYNLPINLFKEILKIIKDYI